MLWLSMIVKNEAPRMLRAFASAVAGGVTRAVVLDTGSTDGTHEAAIEAAAALKLGLSWHKGPFRDFAQARNLALDHLLRLAKRERLAVGSLCVLCLDADEELACPLAELLAAAPRADGYLLPVSHGPVSCPVVKVLRTSRAWIYRGVVHETPTCAKPSLVLLAQGGVTSHFDSERNRDPAAKYRADAALLLAHLDKLPSWHTDPRSVFYLARTLEAAGEPALAAEAYLYRSEMDGFEEEGWYARFRAGALFRAHGAPTRGADLLRRVADERPWRAEPLAELAQAGENVAERLGQCSPRPEDLFADRSVYPFP
jgi:glycosyltransferase involved in cell wall biosynthesis